MNRLFIVILIVFAASCSPKKQQVSYITDFPREIIISEYETLPLDLLSPTQIFVSSEYIAILLRHEEKMISVYDRQSCEHIASFLSEGRGPNEVLLMNRIGQVDISAENLKLKIQSFPMFVTWLDIEGSIREGKTIFSDKIEFDGKQNSSNFLYAANSVYYLGDNSRLLMFMDPDRSQNRRFSSSPFSVVYDPETDNLSDTIYWYPNQMPDAETLLFASMISMSFDRKYLGRANCHINSIIIGDLEKGQIQTICFDENATDLEKALNEKKTHFNDSSADNNYFFAMIEGDTLEPSSEIFVVDWKGKPIAKMIVPLKIRTFCVADSNQIYAVTEDDAIVRFKYNFEN